MCFSLLHDAVHSALETSEGHIYSHISFEKKEALNDHGRVVFLPRSKKLHPSKVSREHSEGMSYSVRLLGRLKKLTTG